jgi:hypothetical protein
MNNCNLPLISDEKESVNVFCTLTNKRTIIPQIITLLHVSTLSCHPQRACNQSLAKLHKYFKCSFWKYWQRIDYKLPEDDTIVSKHVGV